jgi:hypothetical protein
MRGRWAAGIVPRNFTWIIRGRLAVSERPGGQAPHHRRVRRQEEIIWLVAQGFDRVISLLPSNHNLHAYEERNLPAAHFPLPLHSDAHAALGDLYPQLLGWLAADEKILIHQEELGERVSGVIAGFLCWCGVLPEPPRAISAVEQLLRHQMGAAGRSLVAISTELPPPPPGARDLPLTPPDEPESAHPATGEDEDADGTAGSGEAPPSKPRRPRRSRAAGPSAAPGS